MRKIADLLHTNESRQALQYRMIKPVLHIDLCTD
jgi:hypothetical protein